MQLFFRPVQEILFANIESGAHEILSTNLDTSASFANFLEYVCTEIQMCHVIMITVRRQSIKKLNLCNSEPVSARTTPAMVALCSGDFELHSDTSSIMPCKLVIELHSLNECVFGGLGDF